MKTYICEICGDAYIGSEKPKNCPFCEARECFIKLGKEAKPIVNEKPASTREDAASTRGGIEISELSGRNLEETLALELAANLIYLCMADKADSYEVKAMYKRLAKVELEHAVIATKLMGIAMPKFAPQTCSEDYVENFKKTIKLEENATSLYTKFMQEATEGNIKILFTALSQVESDHTELIKNYLTR